MEFVSSSTSSSDNRVRADAIFAVYPSKPNCRLFDFMPAPKSGREESEEKSHFA